MHIEFPPNIVNWRSLIFFVFVNGHYSSAHTRAGCGAGFIIIIDHIDVHRFPPIPTVARPIVKNIIPDMHEIRQRVGCSFPFANSWVSAIMMGDEVVMKRSLPSPHIAPYPWAPFACAEKRKLSAMIDHFMVKFSLL